MEFDYFDKIRKIRTGIRFYSELLIEASWNMWNIKTRVGIFFFSLVAAFAGTYFLAPEAFSEAQSYTLFILIFSILLWATEAIPPFAVGIMIIGFLVYTMGNMEGATLSPQEISATWSDSVIWIFLGGFFLSEGMRKTNLDLSLFKKTLSIFGSNPNTLVLGIIIVTSVLSLIISNTATAAMVLASVMPLIDREGKDSMMSKAILISIPAAATFAGMMSMVSTPPNLIVVNVLKSKGYSVSFMQWFFLGFVPATILLVGFWLAVVKKYTSKVKGLDVSFANKALDLTNSMRLQRLTVIVILIITVGMWMFGSTLHIPTAGAAMVPIMFLPMMGIITAEDVRKLPWDTLMLVAGGLALGMAIKELLAPYYSQFLADMEFNMIAMMIIFAIVTVLFSNIMSSTATATIVINVAAIVLPPEQLLPVGLVVGLCASCGLFLPVSTPPNAIVFGTGLLKQKDFRLGGIFGAVIGTTIIILWVLLLQHFTTFFDYL
ncbi:SLC13 family permease [Myroides phaeus]|uniref:Solute carrier family 13 (Sodium-dependent dicarboxylate transporter), member 2/3/5 n=1 Tax=Myroides phaeus TaxID=702745 RepID=A0A1G8FB02_9FLAO|nr:DASS family sodium-coupled anion symporter [Myroides phaeus]MEC4117784.1 DASS family sodium-coupled anion symporter [Myroides phaeus]SDH79303.1 solute carrier family 13 (sodium-dependent dicarboxylate transporter), member 2/3/5 [Myroides phaeus]